MIDELAERMANGETLLDAAFHLRISHRYAAQLWAQIIDQLGPQAR